MSGSSESNDSYNNLKVSNIIADTKEESTEESGITSEQVDQKERLTKLEDNSYKLREIIKTWKENEQSERGMRKSLAIFILCVLGVEIVLGNLIILLMGFNNNFRPPEWTCNLFFTGMYTQIVAVATIVVKNLFPPISKDPSNAISEIIKNL